MTNRRKIFEAALRTMQHGIERGENASLTEGELIDVGVQALCVAMRFILSDTCEGHGQPNLTPEELRARVVTAIQENFDLLDIKGEDGKWSELDRLRLVGLELT